MPDTFDPATRSWIMSRVKSSGTKPEQTVRDALDAAGIVHDPTPELPGKPDFVIPSARLAIFVNGCFWHWHGCKRSRMPAANRDYWTAKIERNVRRDRRSRRQLRAQGWSYCNIWECSLEAGIARMLTKARRVLS